MSRLPAIQPQAAAGKAKDLLDAVLAKLKITPNTTRVMANSPAVLEAYLSFSDALGHVSLDAKPREEIALQVGEQNSCQYCSCARFWRQLVQERGSVSEGKSLIEWVDSVGPWSMATPVCL
jgi:alkylhydroperoxidase family enzyme